MGGVGLRREDQGVSGGLIAHAGGTGWDEIALIAFPVAVLVVLQILAKRKAGAEKRAKDEDGPSANA